MTGFGLIRSLSAQTRRGRKSALAHLQVERWRELKVIAAPTASTLDRLLQPVGSTHPTGYGIDAHAIIAATGAIALGRAVDPPSRSGVIAKQFAGWVEPTGPARSGRPDDRLRETHRLSETPPQQDDGFHFVQPILRAEKPRAHISFYVILSGQAWCVRCARNQNLLTGSIQCDTQLPLRYLFYQA